ncbi:MAG TPA: periplasmic heavy metal sensor [Rhizomicrobium sp.]|nr:periplasmic heavy metal sensor [Rhizomicrobium sp.]
MDDTPTRPRRSWLLIVSLCLNLALIGGIAVVVYRLAHLDTSVGVGGPLSPKSLAAAFPDRGPAIEQAIAAHQQKILALRRIAGETRRAAFRELADPDYSPQKMDVALKAAATADAELETESVGLLNDSLSTLTPAERQTLVDRVKKRNRSWFFRMMHRQARHG